MVAGILALATALGLLAVAGKPTTIRRPDPVNRPVLLIPDFDNRTGRGEFAPLARQLTEAVRARLAAEPEGIFELSPRRLRPAFGPREREEGLVGIAGRLGADYVLAGSLESGPGGDLDPGSSWEPRSGAGDGEGEIRLDILLVRDSDPPHVFAERFPPGHAGRGRRRGKGTRGLGCRADRALADSALRLLRDRKCGQKTARRPGSGPVNHERNAGAPR